MARLCQIIFIDFLARKAFSRVADCSIVHHAAWFPDHRGRQRAQHPTVSTENARPPKQSPELSSSGCRVLTSPWT
jgi:hypothetical protein